MALGFHNNVIYNPVASSSTPEGREKMVFTAYAAELSGEHTVSVDFCQPGGFSCFRTCFRRQKKSKYLAEIALITITLETL